MCFKLLNWLHMFIITRTQLCAENNVQNNLMKRAERHILFTVMKPVKVEKIDKIQIDFEEKSCVSKPSELTN